MINISSNMLFKQQPLYYMKMIPHESMRCWMTKNCLSSQRDMLHQVGRWPCPSRIPAHLYNINQTLEYGHLIRVRDTEHREC